MFTLVRNCINLLYTYVCLCAIVNKTDVKLTSDVNEEWR